eukprot:TRINITY_DN14759_c0_g3_i1.p1 TRINITY_DN14759_c0_g3~~TRINITY_DN14759_c0_g3_i1.p1  ORF type:complete len:201 (+),score=50.27 TRINITY_DN14759_c0_g3_i1:80-682(+)
MHVIFKWDPELFSSSQSASDDGRSLQEQEVDNILLEQEENHHGQLDEDDDDDDEDAEENYYVDSGGQFDKTDACPHCFRNHDAATRPNKVRREQFKLKLQAIHEIDDEVKRASRYIEFLKHGTYACKLMHASGVDLKAEKRRAANTQQNNKPVEDSEDWEALPPSFDSARRASSSALATSSTLASQLENDIETGLQSMWL